MDKKLKKVLVWSSVISVVCIIFLYSISYVFPIPAIEIKELPPMSDDQANTISPLDSIPNMISAFEYDLIEANIPYTKYRKDNYLQQFFVFKKNNNHYLKTFFIYSNQNNENISNKLIYDTIQVDGDKLVSVQTASNEISASFFVYNKHRNVVIEYFLSGKTGRTFQLYGEPNFIHKWDSIELYNCFIMMDKNKLIYLSLYNNIEKYFYWNAKVKPTGFIYYNYEINGNEQGSEEHTFIAYNGASFYLFDYKGELILKKSYSKILTQITPNSQIYCDRKKTYIVNVSDARKWLEEKNITIELVQILNFSIPFDVKLDNINSNKNVFYFGKQKLNNYELGMLNLRSIRNYSIEEIDYYKFIIPGQLIEINRRDFIDYFKTSFGLFVIPQWIKMNEKIKTSTICCQELDQYPYETIYGESHFAIRKILRNFIIKYGGSNKPDNLEKLINTFLPFLISFSVVVLLFMIPIHLSKAKRKSKNSQ